MAGLNQSGKAVIPGQTTPNSWHQFESLREIYHCELLTLVDGSIAVHEEDTCTLTVLESSVVLIRHGRVYHHDVMLVMIMKVSDELLHLLQWESIGIQCENLGIVRFQLTLVWSRLTFLKSM